MSEIIRLQELDSTNEYLKKLAKSGAESGTVVIANSQYSGKGSKGRSFESPEGGLYLSYLYNLESLTDEIVNITQWSVVAVHHAILSFCQIDCQMKYINDIIFNGKKICGILTELTDNHLIIGIGINVNTRLDDFSEAIRDSATSLYEITGKIYDIDSLACNIIHELCLMFTDFPDNSWRKRYYDTHCIYLDKAIM